MGDGIERTSLYTVRIRGGRTLAERVPLREAAETVLSQSYAGWRIEGSELFVGEESVMESWDGDPATAMGELWINVIVRADQWGCEVEWHES